MAGEVIGVQGVRITDLPEAEAVVDSNYMILVDEETGRTYKVKREHVKAQKTSELVDDVGFLRAIPDEYMTESEVKEFTNTEIAQIRDEYMTESEVKEFTNAEITQIREVLNTWEAFKNNGGDINGDINVNNANLNGSLNFSGLINNTDLKTENKKIFDVKRDTGDQIYFGNGSLKMVLDAKEFNAYGAFNCHSGINIPNNSINSTGYTKLPNGLIMEWGETPVFGTSGYTVLFPISFPNSTLTISVTPYTKNGFYSEAECKVGTKDKYAFNVWGNVDQRALWIAIGY